MKVNKITNNLEERFDNRYTKNRHYNDHVTADGQSNDPKYPNKLTFTFEQFPTADAYEKAADALARTPVSKEVLGYVRNDGRYAKYKKATKELVIYTIEHGEPIDITYFPCERSYWDSQKEKKNEKEGYSHSIDSAKDVK